MQKLLFMALLSIAFLQGAEAKKEDWKYYGEDNLSKGDAVIFFYDAESIERSSDGQVRAWTKGISLSEVERTMNIEEITKRATGKIKAGYAPPYILSNPKHEPGNEVNTRIIFWEEAANYDVIKTRLKVLYEVNCTAKKIRSISSVSYKNDSGTESSADADTWVNTSPESNPGTLQKILCRQRDVIK